MNRLIALAVLLSSCATTGAPVGISDLDYAKPVRQQSLRSLLFGEPPPASCPENRTIPMLGPIDDESADVFVRTLGACKGKRVVVEINSPGGSLFAAMEMQKAIERHDSAVFCVVDGMAASAAFVTLQSCTSRYATARSLLMAHHASLTCQGQEQEMKNCGEALRAIDEGLSAHCAKRMEMSRGDFESHVSGGREWYMSLFDGLKFKALDGEAESVAEIQKMIAN